MEVLLKKARKDAIQHGSGMIDQSINRFDLFFITVTVSYIELYNKQIVDLLTESQYKNR